MIKKIKRCLTGKDAILFKNLSALPSELSGQKFDMSFSKLQGCVGDSGSSVMKFAEYQAEDQYLVAVSRYFRNEELEEIITPSDLGLLRTAEINDVITVDDQSNPWLSNRYSCTHVEIEDEIKKVYLNGVRERNFIILHLVNDQIAKAELGVRRPTNEFKLVA